MILLRRVIGDALRARRQAQHRTLREVSTAANVSLGYLSEIERGQKEASSELLSSICDALGTQLSEVLRDVSDTMALAEQMDVLVPAEELPEPAAVTPSANPAPSARAALSRGPAGSSRRPEPAHPKMAVADGQVSVAVHHDGPLKATLRATRTPRPDAEREVVYAA